MISKEVAKGWIEKISETGLLKRLFMEAEQDCIDRENYREFLYPASIEKEDQNIFGMAKIDKSNEALFVAFPAKRENKAAEDFEGYVTEKEGFIIKLCELSDENAFFLRDYLKYANPSFLPIDGVTIGVGDRLGLATPGHIRSFIGREAVPVFAQQSVRELDLTGRSFMDVLSDVIWAVFRAGFKNSWGADGDHLKSEQWIKEAVDAGFRMITVDVSDSIRDEYYTKTDSVILSDYGTLNEEYRGKIEKHFLNREFSIGDGMPDLKKVRFTRAQLAKCALIYGKAVDRAASLYRSAVNQSGSEEVNFELSVDEVSIPTTPQDHIFIVELLEMHGVKLFSIAPRFSGSFQKGIDYEGKLTDFEKDLRVHHSIAVERGYKISVHSGSDKFRIFPIISRVCGRRFHLKTSGTSWLESLRVLAKTEPSLFRKVYRIALDKFDIARRLYHVKADRQNAPQPDSLRDDELQNLLANSVTRQILHITYGEILKDKKIREDFYSTMKTHRELYWEYLEKHIGKHLEALGID